MARPITVKQHMFRGNIRKQLNQFIGLCSRLLAWNGNHEGNGFDMWPQPMRHQLTDLQARAFVLLTINEIGESSLGR